MHRRVVGHVAGKDDGLGSARPALHSHGVELVLRTRHEGQAGLRLLRKRLGNSLPDPLAGSGNDDGGHGWMLAGGRGGFSGPCLKK